MSSSGRHTRRCQGNFSSLKHFVDVNKITERRVIPPIGSASSNPTVCDSSNRQCKF
uniref:Uncharacterized protein n=1 Tax=Arundo donax TaxID=35708 RepID=A0A0A8YTB5_ARUDO